VLVYPIRNIRDEPIGVIQLINKSSGLKFSETDIDLLSAFSAQIGMCIEHCTNYEQLNARHEALLAEHRAYVALASRLPELLGSSELSQLCQSAQRLAASATCARAAHVYVEDRASGQLAIADPRQVQLPPTSAQHDLAEEVVAAGGLATEHLAKLTRQTDGTGDSLAVPLLDADQQEMRHRLATRRRATSTPPGWHTCWPRARAATRGGAAPTPHRGTGPGFRPPPPVPSLRLSCPLARSSAPRLLLPRPRRGRQQ
jgi:hypothetical protein